MMGFGWNLDTLNADCGETWKDLRLFPSASNIKMPPEFQGKGGFGWSEKSLCWSVICLLKQEYLQLPLAYVTTKTISV